ncbi:MAG: FtsB family cell division protein [Patescibacteria group bacterium]
MKDKLIPGILLIFGLYLIVSFSRDILSLLEKSKEQEKEQLKLEKLEIKNEELKKQLEYVKSQEFVEKQAREKLGLAREGEVVVILPENVGELVKPKEEKKEEELPNWKRWLKLFFD